MGKLFFDEAEDLVGDVLRRAEPHHLLRQLLGLAERHLEDGGRR